MFLTQHGTLTGMIIEENSSMIFYPDGSTEENKDITNFRTLTYSKNTCITECFQVNKVRHEELIEAVIFNDVEQIRAYNDKNFR